MLNLKRVNRILHRLMEASAVVSAFLMIHQPACRGVLLTSVLDVSTLVLCAHLLAEMYRRGLLSKTMPQIYQEARERPLFRSRVDPALEFFIVVFAFTALQRP